MDPIALDPIVLAFVLPIGHDVERQRQIPDVVGHGGEFRDCGYLPGLFRDTVSRIRSKYHNNWNEKRASLPTIRLLEGQAKGAGGHGARQSCQFRDCGRIFAEPAGQKRQLPLKDPFRNRLRMETCEAVAHVNYANGDGF